MTDANNVVHVAQRKLQQFIRQDAGGVCEAEQGVVGENGPQAHCSGMDNGLATQVAQAGMSVHDLNLLSYDDVAEDGKEGKDGGEGGFAIDDEEGHMVHLKAVRQVAHTSAAFVGMRDDDNFVATVNELGRQLVDVRLDSPYISQRRALWCLLRVWTPTRLGEEEVADHAGVRRVSRWSD